MPRIARLDTPGLLHHIMIRGIERRRIFNRKGVVGEFVGENKQLYFAKRWYGSLFLSFHTLEIQKILPTLLPRKPDRTSSDVH